MNMDLASLGLVAKATGCELAWLQAAHPYPYPRIGRVANILVADLVCEGTGDA